MLRRTAAGLAVAAVVAAGGGGVAGYQFLGPGSLFAGGAGSATTTAALAPLPPPAPQVVVAQRDAQGRVPWDAPLRLVVEHGALRSVAVTDPSGATLNGTTSPDATEWRAANTLVPLDTYHVSVDYAGERGGAHHETFTVQAADAAKHLNPVLDPAGGDVVGVGQPVIIYFNHDVPSAERAAVERRLAVQTTPAVTGSWHWISGSEVHWRPPHYWASGTVVHFSVNLSHLYFGDGVWGDPQPHHASFRIGDAHISKVDVAGHVMRVYDNGTLVKTFPISAGRDKYPTMSGVHITMDKSTVVTMDSATVGIPRNSPDGYYEKVYWDVRISNGGEFVHAAPWSVADQGNTNVSHGCVNLSPANAQWFYNFDQRGDIVDVYNSPRPPVTWDAGTADWNMSWAQWVAGSALH